jgi:ParB-like chromosome segregation protein Spo0J
MAQFGKKTIFEIIKATISSKPGEVGATISEPMRTQEPVVNIPVKKISRLEPVEKFKKPEHARNLKRIVQSMKKGRTMPPISVRRTSNGYQAVDGHHRLRAHEILNRRTIRARVISPRNITTEEKA